MKETSMFGASMGLFQLIFIVFALAAVINARYGVATLFACAAVLPAVANYRHYQDAQHDAPTYLLYSLICTGAIAFILLIAAIVVTGSSGRHTRRAINQSLPATVAFKSGDGWPHNQAYRGDTRTY